MKFKRFILKSVDSTNSYAIRLIKKKISKPSMIIATQQTKGRGRMGRKWISLRGNLFLSFFFQINKKLSLGKATKKNCSILKDILKKFVFAPIKIKPPNDIFINGGKLCGILQETVFFKKKKFLIIGIGINLIKSPVLQDYKTSYLSEFTRKKVGKKTIYNLLAKEFQKKYKLS